MSSPGAIDWKVPPTTPANAGQPRPEGEHQDEDALDPHTRGRQHVAIVDAGPDQHADARLVQRDPHCRMPSSDGGRRAPRGAPQG